MSAENAKKTITAVVGVGPGLGAAVARRFAQEGHAIALVARSRGSLDPVEKELGAAGARVASFESDATNPASVAQAFARVRETLGDPAVLVYNAGAFKMGGILEISPEDFDACWRANCAGAFYAAREVVVGMLAKGAGTVILTGATA